MVENTEFRNEKAVPYKGKNNKSETNIFGVGAMDNHEKLNPSTTYREKDIVVVCCCVKYNCGGAVLKND
ncbi:hypothetical protein D6861_008695 [Macrococcoides caseolyticum]|nr:hypothetical protein [Macrococcus caseolyticus]RKO14003.1 hypothetical protein D6861_08780 [Macrococcus caseolyticus]